MTFFPVFGRQKKRHTNLWLFWQFSDGIKNDIQTYDFFPSFRTAKKTTYKPMTFFPVFGRQKKHTNLWLFWQFSDGKKNDYDFFPSFRTAKKTTYKPMTFLTVFGRQKNDIQTYDFFPSFRTAKKTTYKPMTFFPVFGRQKNDIQTYDFFPSFRTAKKTTYKPMTFFPVFGRQKKRHTNLWLFSQFSDGKKNDIQTYDFFPSFWTAKKTTYKPMTFFPVFGRQKKRHTNLWLFSQFSDGKKNDICVTWICVCYFHTWTQFNLQLSFILYSGWRAAVCQRSAVLLWLQLWGQTPLISENWIWLTTTCRTQEWRSCVVFYRVQPVDWRLWGQFTDFCRSHIYKTAFIHNLSHLILI